MEIVTQGIHHIGLSVRNLESTVVFFTKLLGFKEIRRDPAYPSVFIQDGQIILTLWQIRAKNQTNFDRKHNTGLHHLAFKVKSLEALQDIHNRFLNANIKIEFAPQSQGTNSAQHMMCYEPGGIRLEFIFIPDDETTK